MAKYGQTLHIFVPRRFSLCHLPPPPQDSLTSRHVKHVGWSRAPRLLRCQHLQTAAASVDSQLAALALKGDIVYFGLWGILFGIGEWRRTTVRPFVVPPLPWRMEVHNGAQRRAPSLRMALRRGMEGRNGVPLLQASLLCVGEWRSFCVSEWRGATAHPFANLWAFSSFQQPKATFDQTPPLLQVQCQREEGPLTLVLYLLKILMPCQPSEATPPIVTADLCPNERRHDVMLS
ncbi:hypothetical protein BV22DRAFT_1050850 [Leucogyrophana mollusca]|uniref:Uncharacterized protein n=1 Tax=Leucogyrophana mollusca TaxID=85980 RepID=A0ACB8B265_9AGAM|nr:hypothetical protein BV22DRAFT_1050850 [Leucogyrophana mollusca]